MNNILHSDDQVKWIDLINPSHEELMEYSDHYNLDYHTLADCLEPNHLPKVEKLPHYTFVILRRYDKKDRNYPSSIQEMSNKIAIFYSESVIITVHRYAIPFLEEIRTKYLETNRITDPSEIVTKIMWYVVRTFEPVSFTLSEEIDKLERRVFLGSQPLNRQHTEGKITLEELYYLKNSCRLNKKVILLTREVVLEHVTTKTDKSALQDVKDLLQKLYLSFEETHDDAANLSNTYLSIVSQKTNDVMKVLTIFSVFFMPLTFIAGIYGMNFDVMPELHWTIGYPLSLVVMAFLAVLIFIWFKRKKFI